MTYSFNLKDREQSMEQLKVYKQNRPLALLGVGFWLLASEHPKRIAITLIVIASLKVLMDFSYSKTPVLETDNLKETVKTSEKTSSEEK